MTGSVQSCVNWICAEAENRPARVIFSHWSANIDLAKKVKHLHHSVKLNHEFLSDVLWWLNFLPTWNGISMIDEQQWTSSVDMHLYTDASNLAVAGFYQNAWLVELVDDASTTSINWRELYVVVLPAAIWSHHWAGKKVLFHCDNLAVCHDIVSYATRHPRIRLLWTSLGHNYIAAPLHFDFRATLFNTKSNDVADLLSQLDFSRFWRLVLARCRHWHDLPNTYQCLVASMKCSVFHNSSL